MKKTIIIALILILNISVNQAQEDAIVPLRELGSFDEDENKYYYYKDLNLDLNKFIGTWKYQDVTKELIVTFELKTHKESGGDYYDEIYAKFKYTDNGTIIYNTLNDNSESSEHYILGSSISLSGKEISLGYFEPTDITYRRSLYQRLELKYLACSSLGCNPQLKWDLHWTKSKDSDVWPFKIPKDLILTKQ
ncbi:DUF6705 family protein [uncultured Lacinutrix sp.]|uniref:DUF6705 family protein n=1 Tax=uncultured Lacinutrix sp. TaxID=574032 RepID=UPI00263A07A3|nr:DUF6705 family protein [uncultured Lacinutrix sp.]